MRRDPWKLDDGSSATHEELVHRNQRTSPKPSNVKWGLLIVSKLLVLLAMIVAIHIVGQLLLDKEVLSEPQLIITYGFMGGLVYSEVFNNMFRS